MGTKRINPSAKSVMTYRQAVALVALNESPGDVPPDGWTMLEHVSSLVGVALVADIYGVTQEQFARAVIRYRRKNGV